MTEVERYKKLKLDLEDVAGKLVGIPSRLNQLRGETQPTRDDAIKAEYLGDADLADRKRGEIKTTFDEIRKLEADREELTYRRGILLPILEETRKKAEAEIGPVHLRQFERAVKNFATALRLTAKAEAEIVAVRETANRAFVDIESRLVPLPEWKFLIIRGADYSTMLKPEIAAVLAQMKDLGIDLG